MRIGGAEKAFPGSDRRMWVDLGVVDIQPVLPQHADLEGDLLDLLQGLAAEEPQSIQQVEDRVHSQLPSRNLSQPVSSQAAQAEDYTEFGKSKLMLKIGLHP